MLEITLPNKTVQLLSIKELSMIPLVECDCGREFRPLSDTYIDGKPYCAECRLKLQKQ